MMGWMAPFRHLGAKVLVGEKPAGTGSYTRTSSSRTQTVASDKLLP
jgi:hypothetical protein